MFILFNHHSGTKLLVFIIITLNSSLFLLCFIAYGFGFNDFIAIIKILTDESFNEPHINEKQLINYIINELFKYLLISTNRKVLKLAS